MKNEILKKKIVNILIENLTCIKDYQIRQEIDSCAEKIVREIETMEKVEMRLLDGV